LTAERRRRVLVVAYGEETNQGVGVTFAQALRGGGAERVTSFRLWPASGPASYDSVRTLVHDAGLVCVLVAARPTASKPDAVNMPPALAALAVELAHGSAPLVVVALGSPYLI